LTVEGVVPKLGFLVSGGNRERRIIPVFVAVPGELCFFSRVFYVFFHISVFIHFYNVLNYSCIFNK